MPSERDRTSRIDGITAAIIVLSPAIHQPIKKRSKYETQELVEV
jgi:hypothetical protein